MRRFLFAFSILIVIAVVSSGVWMALNASGFLSYGLITEKNRNGEVTVIIGGDVMLDRNVRLNAQKSSYDSLFASIAPLFKSADIAVVNLEGPITSFPSKTLTSNGTLTNSFDFTFAPETATALQKAGVTAVSLANNHTDNFGIEGFRQTKRYLVDAGIKWFGSPWNATSMESVSCVKGICVALVGYHDFQQGFERVLSDVKRLSAEGDFVIVMPHWGEEYSSQPTDAMRTQARELVAAGANAVIGAHSHVIGENEWLGSVPVYYSLGNLLFDQYFSPETMRGLLVKLKISKAGGKLVLDKIQTVETSNAPHHGIEIAE